MMHAFERSAPASAPPLRMAQTIRAACELIADTSAAARAVSVTFHIDHEPEGVSSLLRRAETVTSDFGLRHRIELRGRLATVHVWRE